MLSRVPGRARGELEGVGSVGRRGQQQGLSDLHHARVQREVAVVPA